MIVYNDPEDATFLVIRHQSVTSSNIFIADKKGLKQGAYVDNDLDLLAAIN